MCAQIQGELQDPESEKRLAILKKQGTTLLQGSTWSTRDDELHHMWQVDSSRRQRRNHLVAKCCYITGLNKSDQAGPSCISAHVSDGHVRPRQTAKRFIIASSPCFPKQTRYPLEAIDASFKRRSGYLSCIPEKP